VIAAEVTTVDAPRPAVAAARAADERVEEASRLAASEARADAEAAIARARAELEARLRDRDVGSYSG
jgi:hypothetical protein